MPIVTVTVQKPKSREFKSMVLEAIHQALVDTGVDPTDRFYRVLELEEEDFQFDPNFPDVKTRRTNEFVMVQILLGVGRSVKVKKKIIAGIAERLATKGFDTENLFVCFQDVPWENWSPAGGRVPHA